MFERFGVAVEHVVNVSDVCFELSELNGIGPRKHSSRNAGYSQRFSVSANVSQRVHLLFLNDGRFGREPG